MYKVKYDTLSLMSDGRIGNVVQTAGEMLYTDVALSEIPKALNEFLAHKHRVGCITSLELVKGHVIQASLRTEPTNAAD